MIDPSSSLFTLQIDPTSKLHLAETAKWARFLAIVGFIFLGLMVVAGIISAIAIANMTRTLSETSGYTSRSFAGGIGVGTAFFYVVAALVGFFPLLFMLRFANAMKTAILTDDQELLNGSLQNLKKYFRYVGIVTVMSLVLMGIVFLIGLITAATI